MNNWLHQSSNSLPLTCRALARHVAEELESYRFRPLFPHANNRDESGEGWGAKHPCTGYKAGTGRSEFVARGSLSHRKRTRKVGVRAFYTEPL